MPDAQSTTFVVVGAFAPERVAVYIVKGERDDVIKKAESLQQWFTITTLKAAASQTANPWNGTLLEEVAFTHPTDAFLQAIRYAGHQLRELSEHQKEGAIEKAVAILDQMSKPQLLEPSLNDLPPIENLPLGGSQT